MNRKVELLLRDAISACEHVVGYIDGKGYEEFLADDLLQSGVYWKLSVAGEALNQALAEDKSLGESIPELRAVIGLRNRLVHGYATIDTAIVWLIAKERAPELIRDLVSLLNGNARAS